MKMLFKLITCLAVMLGALVVIVKVVTGGSWSDSVGVVEELWKEVSES